MSEFEQLMKEMLQSLSDKKKGLFASLTVEKLYPHYIAFEKKYRWGDSHVLRDAIILLYQYIMENDAVSDEDIKLQISKIDMITPDMDDFGSELSSFALNAATSIQSALNYLLDRDINHIMDIISFTFDTIDLFIQSKENFDALDPSRDIQIEHDEFMLQEREREVKLIETLSSLNVNVFTEELIKKLRNTKPIIDLSLLPE